MKKEEFLRLTEQPESDTIDFKKHLNDIKKDKSKKSELLKDIISFANTKSNNDSYIVIGVKERGGVKELHGINKDQIIDDAELQQYVNEKMEKELKLLVITIPITINNENKTFQVIKIFSNQKNTPFYLRNDHYKIKKNAIYIRKGSSNSEISPLEAIELYSKREVVNSSLVIEESCHEIIMKESNLFVKHDPIKSEDEIGYFVNLPLVNIGNNVVNNITIDWHFNVIEMIGKIKSMMQEYGIENQAFCA